MKTIFTLCAMVLFVFPSHAQNNTTPLLKSYYEMKDALVASDAATASAKAGEFVKLINADRKSEKSLQEKLAADAGRIAATQDIAKQRELFAPLSLNVYKLAKVEKLSDDAIYQQYCPMKKTYWLSNEAAVKNPYYGKMMLTCGNVTDTIKP
jgi:hypothetical protein